MLSYLCFIAYSQHLHVAFLIFKMHQSVPNNNNYHHNKQPLLNPSRLYVLCKKKHNILVRCVVLILLFFRLFVCLFAFFFYIFTLPTIDRIFFFFDYQLLDITRNGLSLSLSLKDELSMKHCVSLYFFLIVIAFDVVLLFFSFCVRLAL